MQFQADMLCEYAYTETWLVWITDSWLTIWIHAPRIINEWCLAKLYFQPVVNYVWGAAELIFQFKETVSLHHITILNYHKSCWNGNGQKDITCHIVSIQVIMHLFDMDDWNWHICLTVNEIIKGPRDWNKVYTCRTMKTMSTWTNVLLILFS